MTTLLRRAGVVLAGSALLTPFLLAAPAAAHVTATPNEASSPYFRTAFRVPHGCDGAATTAVRIQIPDGVAGPKPEVVPGWEIEIVPADYGEEDEGGHGSAAPVAEVAWVGGDLPDNQFQEFGLSIQITDEAPEVIYFPVVQECEEGEHRWIEIPATVDEWGELDEPAPYVINRTAGGRGSDTTADGDAGGEDAGAGDAAEGPGPVAAADEGSGALPVVALIAGLLGLAAGLAALLVALRSSRRTSTS